MTVEYRMDGQLRPITEYKAALVSSLGTYALAAVPSLAGLPASLSYTLAVATAAMAGTQIVNGRKLMRYQKNLTRLEAFAMTTEELPVSETELYLGKACDCTQVHAQRA